MIYLDNAATTLPKPREVIDAMAWAAGHLASPGRGSSSASAQADELLYDLRLTAGEMFECPPQQALVLLAQGIQRRHDQFPGPV